MLASGWWLAFAGRESNPLDSTERFLSIASDFLLNAGWPIEGTFGDCEPGQVGLRKPDRSDVLLHNCTSLDVDTQQNNRVTPY
jgi:hypothetical protein